MTACACSGTGTILVAGPCEGAEQEAPCPCLEGRPIICKPRPS